jgi:hypothetical protein
MYLRRYTDLPSLLYLLRNRKLTLIDPKSWDDSNDSHYISEYKRKNELASVLALCLTKATETYHHWKIFSGSSSGTCIRFKRSTLLNALKATPVVSGDVQYLMLGAARNTCPKLEDLPYIKRAAFTDENEYRLIYESKTKNLTKLDVDIPLACINRITLSPWLHKSLVGPIKTAIKEIPGCEKFEVVRSSLIGNEEWKKIGENAT